MRARTSRSELRLDAQIGGAARMLGKRHRLRDVIASSSRAGPALPPALRQGACRGPGLQIGSSRSILVGSSCQAARRPSPVSRRSPLTARLGNRADHGDGARGLTAGDVQLRCRGAHHVPGLHQRAAACHAVGAGSPSSVLHIHRGSGQPTQTRSAVVRGGQRLALVTERDHVPVWHGRRAGATRTGSPGPWR